MVRFSTKATLTVPTILLDDELTDRCEAYNDFKIALYCLKNDDNKHLNSYQGAELQFVGFDELTQFPENQYNYLHSRLRKLKDSDIPIRMRGASNPGGIGHDWVKKKICR